MVNAGESDSESLLKVFKLNCIFLLVIFLFLSHQEGRLQEVIENLLSLEKQTRTVSMLCIIQCCVGLHTPPPRSTVLKLKGIVASVFCHSYQ